MEANDSNNNTVETKNVETNTSENIEQTTIKNQSPHRKGSDRSSRKASSKKFIIPPPPRATPSSSSGFPGVSWNKRMGAWLAFYYDQGTRRSRTFHPKYFDMDVEKAKLAAIDFMNNIEKQPRCSLRKSRRDKNDRTWSACIGSEYEGQYSEIAMRKRRSNAGVNPRLTGSRDYITDGIKRSPLSCSTQASIGEMYFDSLRPRFMPNTALGMDKGIMGNSSSVNSGSGGMMEPGMVRGAIKSDILEMTPNIFSQSLIWGNCHNIFMNGQDFCHSSQDSANFSVPSFEGEFTFGSPGNRTSVFHNENNNLDNGLLCIGHVGDFETTSPIVHDDPEIRKLMQSIAPSDNVNSFNGPYNPYNCSSNSLSSPYLSPYTLYKQNDDVRSPGFQNIILTNDNNIKQRNHCLYPGGSPYDILPIDSN